MSNHSSSPYSSNLSYLRWSSQDSYLILAVKYTLFRKLNADFCFSYLSLFASLLLNSRTSNSTSFIDSHWLQQEINHIKLSEFDNPQLSILEELVNLASHNSCILSCHNNSCTLYLLI